MALGAIALVARHTLDGLDAMTVGPEGGVISSEDVTVVVPPGAVANEAAVRITALEDDATASLPKTVARSPMLSIEIDEPLQRAVELRFPVEGAPTPDGRLLTARRENDSQMWTLQAGRYDARAEEFSVSTRDLSDWQLVALEVATEAVAAPLRFAGVRATPPTCTDPPADFELHGDTGVGDANALLFACLDTVDGDLALRLANNRAIGLEYPVPSGMRVGDQSGSHLANEIADVVDQTFTDSSWRSLPSGGTVTLIGVPPTDPIVVRPSMRALVIDLALAVVRQLGGRQVQAALDYVQCVRGSVDQLDDGPPESPRAALTAAQGVWATCGQTLVDVGAGASATAGALYFGGTKIGVGLLDGLTALIDGRSASIEIKDALSAELANAPAGALGRGNPVKSRRSGLEETDAPQPDGNESTDQPCREAGSQRNPEALPHEPNDSLREASGPLLDEGPYRGSIDTTNDRDLFVFCVAKRSQVSIRVRKVGGGRNGGVGFGLRDETNVYSAGSSSYYAGDDDSDPLDETVSAGRNYLDLHGYCCGDTPAYQFTIRSSAPLQRSVPKDR